MAGLTISGTQASDYILTEPTTTANITPATPTISVSVSGGTYNGSDFSLASSVTGLGGQAASELEGIAPVPVYYDGGTATGAPLCRARSMPAPTPSWPASQAVPTMPRPKRHRSPSSSARGALRSC